MKYKYVQVDVVPEKGTYKILGYGLNNSDEEYNFCNSANIGWIGDYITVDCTLLVKTGRGSQRSFVIDAKDILEDIMFYLHEPVSTVCLN